MFGFFLKKNFADGWDNIFYLVISNLFSIVLLVGIYYGLKISFFMIEPVTFVNDEIFINPIRTILFCGIGAIGGGLLMTLIFAYGANASKLANFDTPSFGTFFRSFTYVLKIGFISGFLLVAFLLVVLYGIRFYLTMGNSIGIIMTAVLGWFLIVVVMALQWFVPLYFLQEQNGFVKCLKKSFIIFFDNPWFSIGCFIYNLILLVLSVICFFLVPGFSGITLSTTNALRLRLKKYDWLEEKCEEDPNFINDRDKRYNVPWDELLAEDREIFGKRDWKSFLFPWK